MLKSKVAVGKCRFGTESEIAKIGYSGNVQKADPN